MDTDCHWRTLVKNIGGNQNIVGKR